MPLWRRHEKVGLVQFNVLIAGAVFIGWVATDVAHAPAFAGWLEKRVTLPYRERVGTVRATTVPRC